MRSPAFLALACCFVLAGCFARKKAVPLFTHKSPDSADRFRVQTAAQEWIAKQGFKAGPPGEESFELFGTQKVQIDTYPYTGSYHSSPEFTFDLAVDAVTDTVSGGVQPSTWDSKEKTALIAKAAAELAADLEKQLATGAAAPGAAGR